MSASPGQMESSLVSNSSSTSALFENGPENGRNLVSDRKLRRGAAFAVAELPPKPGHSDRLWALHCGGSIIVGNSEALDGRD